MRCPYAWASLLSPVHRAIESDVSGMMRGLGHLVQSPPGGRCSRRGAFHVAVPIARRLADRADIVRTPREDDLAALTPMASALSAMWSNVSQSAESPRAMIGER